MNLKIVNNVGKLNLTTSYSMFELNYVLGFTNMTIWFIFKLYFNDFYIVFRFLYQLFTPQKSHKFRGTVANNCKRCTSALWNTDSNGTRWNLRACRSALPTSARVLPYKVRPKVHLSSVFSVWSLWLLFSICYWELSYAIFLCLL